MAISRDITKLKHSQDEMARAREQAEQANQAKSIFLATIGHELRTPLSSVLGYAELMRDSRCGEQDSKDHLDVIIRNATHLGELMSDIIDIGVIESGKLSISKSPSILRQEVDWVVDQLQETAASKRLDFRVKCDVRLPEFVCIDPKRFRQVLVNLLSNALKYTQAGHVSLSVYRMQDDLIVDVADSGQGISCADAHRIFEPFRRCFVATESKMQTGVGLGLYLSRKLCEAMGGDLNLIETSLGKGSLFRARIGDWDLATMKSTLESNVQRREVAGSLCGNRILVVEDNIDLQRLMTRLLAGTGAQVSVAENGQEAVDLALKENFDVILMDVQLPILDGYSATKILRSKKYKGSIIALTAHATKGERERSAAAGCDTYLCKPVHRQVLFSSIQEWSARSTLT